MIPIRDDQPRFSTPFVNYFIVALNALAFFYELSIQTQGHRALDRFVYQFGVVPTHVELALAHLNLAGVFLPILTSMFLHGSWLHIVGNMWVLWIFGDNIEDHLGHFSYLIFYLISGFVAASLSGRTWEDLSRALCSSNCFLSDREDIGTGRGRKPARHNHRGHRGAQRRWDTL